MARRRTWSIIVIVVVLVLGGAGFYVWYNFIRDTSAPKFTAADVDAAAGCPSPSGAVADATGSWTVTDKSSLGYRVEEILTGINTTATGRTNQVTGTLTLTGTKVTATDLTVDVATIKSDKSNRDGQFRGPIMDTSEFPNATFTLTQPIDLGAQPKACTPVTATATGDLTLRGQKRSVTFPVDAEYGSALAVKGSIPVKFSDYGIDNPSNFTAKVGNDGFVEFLLVFSKG